MWNKELQKGLLPASVEGYLESRLNGKQPSVLMVLLKIASGVWFQLKATWKVVYAGTMGLWMTAIAHPASPETSLCWKKKIQIFTPYMMFSA